MTLRRLASTERRANFLGGFSLTLNFRSFVHNAKSAIAPIMHIATGKLFCITRASPDSILLRGMTRDGRASEDFSTTTTEPGLPPSLAHYYIPQSRCCFNQFTDRETPTNEI